MNRFRWQCGVALLVIFVWQVNCQCGFLVYKYYQCKYNSTGTPSVTLDESFYRTQLTATTFDDAMTYFKGIYNDLGWSICSSTTCLCVRGDAYLGKLNYGWFFLDSRMYSDMISVVKAVRNKYTRLNQTANSLAIGQFCSLYDYSFETLAWYNETKACLTFGVNEYYGCSSLLSNPSSPKLAYETVSNLENYLMCVKNLMSACDVEIKRAFIYNMLSMVADIVKGGGLLTYIDYILASNSTNIVATNITTDSVSTTTTSTRTTASPSTRRVVFSIGDPHIRSVQKGFETCNFEGTTNLISNSKLSIDVTAVQISGQSVTVMTEIKLTFVNGNLTTTYTASNSTTTKVPSNFDNQNATVLDSTGSKWLELTVISSNSFVYIKDYNSRSTIMVGFMFWHLVFVKTSDSILKTGGLLYSGCPSDLKDTRFSRRKRQTGTAACSTVTSSDPDIPTSSLQSACTADATVNPTLPIASGYSLAASAAVTMTSADNSAFGTASSGGGGGSSFSNSIHAFSFPKILILTFGLSFAYSLISVL